MHAEPVVVFLHGVGTGDPDRAWMHALSASLTRIGYPARDPHQVIAPLFAHALKGADDKASMPAVTVKAPTGAAARQNRREYERRTAAIEFRIGHHHGGDGNPVAERTVAVAMESPWFKQADNYLHDSNIRSQVLHRILSQLPRSGEMVIIAHSLGSVIAADLIRRLDPEVKVAAVITIGSPLASGVFNVDKIRQLLEEPPPNLGWWVNFWNPFDPVTARRGLSSVLPWLLDFTVQTPFGLHVHDATSYLTVEAVAEAIGFATFGSRSRELAVRESGVDIPLDTAETLSLLALRYNHLLGRRLDGETLDRFSGALRQVQAVTVARLVERNAAAGRGTPELIARLQFDFSDPGTVAPEPLPSRHMDKEEALVPLVVLATANTIDPFEIAIKKDTKQAALSELTAEMGLGSQLGNEVFSAIKSAQDALAARGTINWIKWAALGVGATAIVVATGGLALAAGAGLVGAAAITSALAAFGPGGMIGGLLTAGALATAGGGGIAFGLASPATSAETLELFVEQQLVLAALRGRLDLDQDPTVWANFVAIEAEARRQYERMDEFSDASAESLKELKRKIRALERAIAHIRSLGLQPTAEAEADASAG